MSLKLISPFLFFFSPLEPPSTYTHTPTDTYQWISYFSQNLCAPEFNFLSRPRRLEVQRLIGVYPAITVTQPSVNNALFYLKRLMMGYLVK